MIAHLLAPTTKQRVVTRNGYVQQIQTDPDPWIMVLVFLHVHISCIPLIKAKEINIGAVCEFVE